MTVQDFLASFHSWHFGSPKDCEDACIYLRYNRIAYMVHEKDLTRLRIQDAAVPDLQARFDALAIAADREEQ